ncbi:MAG: trypsin-like peptidase domain-containing protein [Lentisphaerae bacterium]|nr:trypsin-like peptidase domain-containing protein [Lentisphaerota bacterium]
MSRRVTAVLALLLCAAGAPGQDDAPSRMVRATIKIFHKDSVGTGFLVAPPGDIGAGKAVLVTAKHILEKTPGGEVLLVMRKARSDGQYGRQDVPARIREAGKPRWVGHDTEDVAALVVGVPEGLAIEPLPFAMLAAEKDLVEARVHTGSTGWVLGFPTRFEANAAGIPVCRHASIASFPLTPVRHHHWFLADFCTFSGDSGGPMFVADPRAKDPASAAPLVVGLVSAHFRHDEEVKTLFEERMIHHSLNLSKMIQAEFIRETVVRAAGDAASRP